MTQGEPLAGDDTPAPETTTADKLRKLLQRVTGGPWVFAAVAVPSAALVLGIFVYVQGSWTNAVSRVSDLVWGPVVPGILSLEPPQVYTRERLVNDRFRQANWLENQLNETNEPARIDEIGKVLQTISRQTGLDVTFTAPQTDVENEKTEQKQEVNTPAMAAMGSYGQRLIETDKLRTRLRTDLMDTLLDDGHDLEGNTLYRLNFDAVVMPSIGEWRYPGTAVYVIRARNPYAQLDADPCAKTATPAKATEQKTNRQQKTQADADRNGRPAPETTAQETGCTSQTAGGWDRDARKQMQLRDDIELLRDWQTEIQRFLTRVVEQRIELFTEHGRLDNPVDPKEDIALDWYLRLRLIESFLASVVLDPEIRALCPVRGSDTSAHENAQPGWTRADANRCKDWIAQTLGLEWRSTQKRPSPEFDFSNPIAEKIEVSFRRGIKLAAHVNAVRHEAGQMASVMRTLSVPAPGADLEAPRVAGGVQVECAEDMRVAPAVLKKTVTETCATQTAQKGNEPAPSDQTEQPQFTAYQDVDHKKALVRMITVWQAMREWELLRPPEPVPGGEGKLNAQKPDTDDKLTPEQKLIARLGKYQEFEPTDADIRDARKQLVTEAQGILKLETGLDTCVPADAAKAEVRFEFYRCAMIHANARQMSNNVIAQFVVARLRDELPIYDWNNHLKLSDFVDIRLAACGTTGCRIQVKQHKDVPIREFIGGRETEREFDWAFLENLLETPEDPINVKLTDEGIALARRLLGLGGLGVVKTSALFVSVKELNQTQARQRQEILSCLNMAEELSLSEVARAEAYFACRLRYWVDVKRSDVSVYAVSPRAGSGDDLVASTEEVERRFAASGSAVRNASSAFAATDSSVNQQVMANPSVIGFSVPPGRQSSSEVFAEHVDKATFGWAIRPARMANGEGYLASRHRLSAVISVPSWWKRIEFEVQACWIMTDQIGAEGWNDSRSKQENVSFQHENRYEKLCETVSDRADGFERVFQIQVPRRVAEITDRFNFDFIKAPYFYRDFTRRAVRGEGLSLEAGRSGKLVLHGERLWRGTFVTVNQQPANSIVVLPDMKGVVASFDCVRPPDGFVHLVRYNLHAEQKPIKPIKAVPVPMQVWTSQGSTDPLQVQVFPFIQRVDGEKPCWLPKE